MIQPERGMERQSFNSGEGLGKGGGGGKLRQDKY